MLKSLLIHLAKISSNYYSFLSGILVALATNLYTGVFTGDQIPIRSTVIISSSLLALISSACWILLSWKLDPLQKLAFFESPKGITPEKTLRALLSGKERLLVIYFSIAILSGISALVVLTLGFRTFC